MNVLVEDLIDVLADRFNRGHSINCIEKVLLIVVSEDGRSHCVVCLHSLSEYLSIVILALDERLTSQVVLSLNLGWVELYVVASSTCRVNAASLNSLHEDIIIDLELDGLVDLLTARAKHAVKFLGLNSCPGEAVQEESSLALWVL